MEPQNYISMASVGLAALIALFGGFRYIAAQVEGLRREINAAEKSSQLLVDKAAEHEAKQRHQLANQFQQLLSTMGAELRELQRDGVKHAQMNALEQRMQTSFAKIESKVDRLGEQSGELVALRQAVNGLSSRLDKLVDRIDSNSTGKS